MSLPGYLSARFPRTRACFQEVPGGDDILAHVLDLEARFGRRDHVAIAPSPDGPFSRPPDFDVALAGGGLSLIYAAALARQGFRVAVFDRRRIGCGHREWNISRDELFPLWQSGLFTRDEVDRLIKMQYRVGLCRWHGGGTYPVAGVLDCVVDAEALLSGLRQRALSAGATLLDHHGLEGYRVGPSGVTLTLRETTAGERPGDPVKLTARLLLDGMGASSPHARFDLSCPTVGGIMSGLHRGKDPLDLDPEVGEILVTTEGIEQNRQHIWEGFPAPPRPNDDQGRDPATADRMTIYLFHYCEPRHLGQHPLLDLYERFFTTLPRYKRGALSLDKATYGFIPAYTRLQPMPVSPAPRVLLVGDAASRHSPLTFCGFGSMIRSFWPISQGIAACLRGDRLTRRALAGIFVEPPALRVMGGLTLMMSPRGSVGGDPGAINRLLDAAFATLAELGEGVYASFIRDEIGYSDFVCFMRGSARRYPAIYREAFRRLSIREILIWAGRLAALAMRPRKEHKALTGKVLAKGPPVPRSSP